MSAFAWTFSPIELAPLALLGVLYAVRLRRLRRRRRLPAALPRASAFYAGLLVTALALASPVDSLGEDRLLSAHMVQHVLLGDLGPLLIVLGLSGAILRPLLALPYVGRLRALAHPAAALLIWALALSVWHLPPLYDAALANDPVHAAEHASFFAAGLLMWAALFEPVPGPAWFTAGWKLGYLGVVRLVQATIANVLLFADTPLYAHYTHVPRLWGLSASADQSIAGSILLLEGMFVILAVYGWALARFFAESEAQQDLLEQGVDGATAVRAARYGRRAGVRPRSRGAPAHARPSPR